MTYKLGDADSGVRWMITCFLGVLTAAYAVGLLYVDHTTAMTPQGVGEQFLGTPDAKFIAAQKFAKSPGEMFTFLHNHLFSLSLMFLALGALVHGTSILRPAWKRALMIEPFAALVTTFGGIILVRYVSPVFSWLVILSGITLVAAYVLSVFVILAELWGRPSVGGS